jgi:hypothetical protein
VEFPADEALLFQTVNTVRAYESIWDMAIAFDSIDAFQPEASDKSFAPSLRILRLRILVIALEARFKSLMKL